MFVHRKPGNAEFYVVFRDKAKGQSHAVPRVTESLIAPVEGPWDLNFQQGRGAPYKITLDYLSAWNLNPHAGVFMYVEGKLHLPCTLTVNP